MLDIFRFLARDARGISATDFSLIAAIVAVAGVSALSALGAKTGIVLGAIGNLLT